MKFIVEAWADGWDTEDEVRKDCIERIEGCNSAGMTVRVLEEVSDHTREMYEGPDGLLWQDAAGCAQAWCDHARQLKECLRLADAVLAQIGQRMNNGGAFAVGLDANGAQFMTLVERNRREVIIKARALLDTRGEEVGAERDRRPEIELEMEKELHRRSAECEAWRSGRLKRKTVLSFGKECEVIRDEVKGTAYDTIDDAVDAVMAEEVE